MCHFWSENHKRLQEAVTAPVVPYIFYSAYSELNHPCASLNLTHHSVESGDMFGDTGVILWMCLASERWRYIVRSSLIGWAHTQNYPWRYIPEIGECYFELVVINTITVSGTNAYPQFINHHYSKIQISAHIETACCINVLIHGNWLILVQVMACHLFWTNAELSSLDREDLSRDFIIMFVILSVEIQYLCKVRYGRHWAHAP